MFEEGVCTDLKEINIVWYNSTGAVMANKESNLYLHSALNCVPSSSLTWCSDYFYFAL